MSRPPHPWFLFLMPEIDLLVLLLILRNRAGKSYCFWACVMNAGLMSALIRLFLLFPVVDHRRERILMVQGGCAAVVVRERLDAEEGRRLRAISAQVDTG
jgi:hypothetical protein